MLTKTKNIRIEQRKNGLEIWRIWSSPPPPPPQKKNLAWIHVVVSEKPEFTNDGWTTDARATTVALFTQSSRAKKHKIIRTVEKMSFCLLNMLKPGLKS